jgi:lipoyl(octanoyl) transferase
MLIKDLRLIDYQEAYALQMRLAQDVSSGSSPETLLLLEHPPVYTMGRAGNEENILDSSIEVVRINRGGEVTFHGPGQLIGYPIIDLSQRGCDLHRYLRFLEELLIQTATDFGLETYRVPGKTGVWTDLGKLASIGIGARRWITMHGFALNVSMDLSWFYRINPCGMANCPVTSMAVAGKHAVSVDEVRGRIAGRFESLLDEWLPKVRTDRPS